MADSDRVVHVYRGNPMATTTCTHKHAHYTVDGKNVCYACFVAHRSKARAALVDELTRLLSGGTTLLETWLSGGMTDWSLDAFTGDWRIFYHSSCNESTMRSRGRRDIEAAAPRAKELATHLENRHYRCGTTLQAYCLTCGDALVAITTDRTEPADPACPACAVNLAAFAAMDEAARAEDRAEGY